MTNKDKEIKKALTHFKLHSYALRNGKGLISKRLKVSQEAVEIARNLIKKSIEDTTKVSAPKILILDIETAPMKAYVWKRWKEDVSLDQTISEWFCLAWAAKWLYNPSGEYSSDIISEVLTPSQVKDENDYYWVINGTSLVNLYNIQIRKNGNTYYFKSSISGGNDSWIPFGDKDSRGRTCVLEVLPNGSSVSGGGISNFQLRIPQEAAINFYIN